MPCWWRVRALAALAAALAVSRGTTAEALVGMSAGDVARLAAPVAARGWIMRWLQTHRGLNGHGAEYLPWLALPGSRGRPRAIGWGLGRCLLLAGAPAWTLGRLLRGPRWPAHATAGS